MLAELWIEVLLVSETCLDCCDRGPSGFIPHSCDALIRLGKGMASLAGGKISDEPGWPLPKTKPEAAAEVVRMRTLSKIDHLSQGASFPQSRLRHLRC